MNQAPSNQLALPQAVDIATLARKKTLGSAYELCAELGGFTLDKELQQILGADRAQFSRWHSGLEGLLWPKLQKLMDACGNHAPVLWMLMQCGYDLHSLRKLESETERENRELKEENAALKRVLLSGKA